MGWKDEQAKTIRVSKETRTTRFIKEELMRYYWYIEKYIDIEAHLNEFKKQYEELLNDPPVGGSIITRASGSPDYTNIVIKMEGKLFDLKSNLKYYEKRLDMLDTWLDSLTMTQRNVVLVYVCEYQCRDIEEVSFQLNYATSNVNNVSKRSIQKIYQKFGDTM